MGMRDGEILETALKLFRDVNQRRCRDVFFEPTEWSLSDWGVALAGEVGEACNVVKKIRRNDFGTRGEGRDLLADELADVFCYLDHLAARAGIDLGAAVVRKFNEVSDKRGSTVKL